MAPLTALSAGPWASAPVIDSLLDTDFYKLLMCQGIWRHHPGVRMTYRLINRDPAVRLGDVVDLDAVRAELDHLRTLRVTTAECTWLGDTAFGGERGLFGADFLAWLGSVQLPPYELAVREGALHLTFSGPWPAVMLWEVPAMAVLMELRGRRALRAVGRPAVTRCYEQATARVRDKLARLRTVAGLRVADFGTRRRHGAAWHVWAFTMLREELGDACLGTSNVQLARRLQVPVVGTVGHELLQGYAALAPDDVSLANAPFAALADWQAQYPDPWRVVLPDTYGTAGFLERAPSWLARWGGLRLDSGDPGVGAERVLAWWRRHGEDPATKRLIFSDGLDVAPMLTLHQRFAQQVRVAFGWGTMLTNDFGGLLANDALAPFSLVCKAVEADGRPVVKLSDDGGKATGTPSALARYRRVFG